MVRHQAIGMDDNIELLAGLSQAGDKEMPIFIRKEDRLFLIASRKDVIERAWELDPELSCHNEGPRNCFLDTPNDARQGKKASREGQTYFLQQNLGLTLSYPV